MNEQSPVHATNGDTVTLREYIEAIIAEKDKALGVAFIAQQTALNVATRSLELRLETELRQTETEGDATNARLTVLENFRGRALGFGALLSLISATVGAIIVKFIGG